MNLENNPRPIRRNQQPHDPVLEEPLVSHLEAMQGTLPRDPQKAVNARQAYLESLKQLPPPVSFNPPTRLNEWKTTVSHFFKFGRKEHKTMVQFILSFVAVLTLAFGGGAATVAASQSAMPDEFLYPVKTWTEDLRLDLTADPEEKLELALQWTERRAEEIQALLETGEDLPADLISHFEAQHQQALQLAANMPADQVPGALLQVQQQAQEQAQQMAQLQATNEAAEQTRLQVQTMLMLHAYAAEEGAQDPVWLREQLRDQDHIQLKTGVPTEMSPDEAETPAPGNGQQYGQDDQDEPQGQNQNAAGATTVTPQCSNDATCAQQDQLQDQQQDQLQDQQKDQLQDQQQDQEQDQQKDQQQDQLQDPNNDNQPGNDSQGNGHGH